ncbi:MAG TPA: lysylphosphatidylglycerol synthase transmembrane domain-containing protein [bacterium]|nr:lysylphosphatidylglycerol synthase transmembrane domain-containing protein [bacterium]
MKKYFKLIFGILISIFFIYLSMKNVDFIEVWKSFKHVNFLYYLLIAPLYLSVYYLKTLRWKILLHPLKKISFRNLYPIIWISFMLLIILPARLGEFARAYLIGDKEKISKTSAFSTVVIERILDGCASILLFLIAVIISPQSALAKITFENMPALSRTSEFLFGFFFEIAKNSNNTIDLSFPIINLVYLVSIFYIAALMFVVLLKIFKTHTIAITLKFLFFLPKKIKQKVEKILLSFIQGLEVFSNFKSLLNSILYSLLIWFICGLYTYLMVLSFGIKIDFYIAFIILGFTIIGVMIPAAPGFIGTYHYMTMIAFKYYSIANSNLAASFAWVSWAIGTLPIILGGLYYLKKEKLTIKSIKEHSQEI